MKRLREESYAASQFKRPFGGSRGESYRQGLHIGGPTGAQKLTTDDALQYLKEVKEMFQDQREKYDHFLEVMKDFKAQRIDTEGVIARVKDLFKGHNNLIYGFNTFLPKGYEITLDEDEVPPKKVVEFGEAISFVNKIKRRFQNDDRVYKSFLDILNMYRKEHKTIGEVYAEVSKIFEKHLDLLDEFKRFLPDNSLATPCDHAQHGRSTIQQFEERSSLMHTSGPMHLDKRWRRDKVSTSHAEHGSIERADLDDDKGVIKLHKDQKKREKEIRDKRNRDSNDTEVEHETNKDSNMQCLPDKKKPPRKEGLDPLAPCVDKNVMKSTYSHEFVFCEKVKEKLRSSDDYQAFLKCLHIYSTEIITRSELQSLVADLLGKYPDLMEGFNEFLERCESIDGFLAGVLNKRSLLNDGHASRSDKDNYLKHELENAKVKDRNKEKYRDKSIQELDLSNCQLCTPSYRLLPDDYPIPTASQRSEIGAQVLNDCWVSVTSGSEDTQFKHMRKNQYEESLFRCEDDRFELDMLLESVSSTAKRAEDLLSNINNTVNGDSPICIEEHFTPLNLRFIERLYGDHGLDVLDILRKNPSMALPVILTRLKQKQEAWSKCRAHFNRVWAEVYAKNHFKSLDQRSFSFKQQDLKDLSTKSLISEIKVMKENMQKEDDALLAIAAGNKRYLVPHLEYEYPDSDIHEDLYKLVKFASEEVCATKEQFNKVMRLWTNFLEPLLGVQSLSHSSGSAECSQASHYYVNNVASGVGENNVCPAVDAVAANFKLEKCANIRTLSEPGKCCGTDTADDSATTKVGCSDMNPTRRDGSSPNVEQEKAQNNVGVGVKVPEQSMGSNTPLIGADASCGRMQLELASGLQSTFSRPLDTAEESCEEKPKAVIQDVAGPVTMLNRNLSGSYRVNRYVEDPVSGSKIEKEEGELSPNGEFEEDNSVVDEDDSVDLSKGKCNGEPRQYQDDNDEDAGLENDVDADDEDSGNGSEAGDDASGSESAGDECSRDEHDEEEDAEHDEIDGKAESEGEADVMVDAHHPSGDGTALPLSESFLTSVKPLAKYISSVMSDIDKKDSRVFYGNDNFYVLFRLHQILYERMGTAKMKSRLSETGRRNLKEASSLDPYASFVSALYNLLDGSSDNAKFEDDCRDIIGHQSYVLFTLDKLIYKLVKQLQTVASDEMDHKLLQLHDYENSRKPGKFVDSVYHDNARVAIHDENIYRIECSYPPARMTIQLMDSHNEKPEVVAVSIDPKFSSYLHKEFLSVVSGKKEEQEVMMHRNAKQYAALDERSATAVALEGVQMFNGLECKIACNTSKISYVLDTEDYFFRLKKKRKKLSADQSLELSEGRVKRFHRFLERAWPML